MAPMTPDQLRARLDDLLEVDRYSDYAPNGLQVEGRGEVRRVVTGVTASVALIEAALEREADLIVAHHGILWGNLGVVRGGLAQRLRLLLTHGVTLLAYHLPLDAHAGLGNNACLCDALGLSDRGPFFRYKGQTIGLFGRLPAPEPLDAFRDRLGALFTIWDEFPHGPARIERVGVVSGGAADAVYEAAWTGLDALLTGEPSEFLLHAAREEGIHVFAAGHHATEVFGVRALAGWITRELGLPAEFVDIPNPI